MTLGPGTRIGPYEVIAAIAAGGMGEVYRASDPRLGREVAIKVITAALAHDPDALARFEREARAAAALNHPSILGVFDVGNIDGMPFIVTELLEGTTLHERLRSGGLPVRRVLEWASRVAEALAAVHGRGVVHRDLKPANIFITADDRVKVLDFGVAKLIESEASEQTRTFEADNTATGIVVGTTVYMSPEQVVGKPVDHRSDIFSLGVVIYEMLTGHRPFQRDTQLATMSAIAEDEAAPPSSVVAGIPTIVDQIVHRCLQKRPEARFQSASDLAFALSAATSSHPALSVVTARSPSRRRLIAVLAAGAAVAVAMGAGGAALVRQSGSVEPRTAKHFLVDLSQTPLSEDLVPIAISPDGGTIAFTTGLYEGRQIAVRRLESLAVTVLPGTLGGREPFFSPDGRYIAFRGGRELRKIPATGGPVVELVAAGQAMGVASSVGGSWGTDGHIYYSYGGRLWRVPEAGGTPNLIATPDGARNEGLYEWPQVLPGNTAMILTVVTTAPAESSRVAIMPLGGGPASSLVEGAAYGRYLSSGHLFYVQGGTGFVAPFDPRSRALTGPAVAILQNVRTGAGGSAVFAAADDGTLLYVEAPPRLERRLAWVDREGHAAPLDRMSRDIYYPRLSPDGKRIAFSVRERESFNIWIDDTREPAPSRLTIDGASNSPPLWHPDGQSVVFARRQTDRPYELIRSPIETGKASDVLVQVVEPLWPASFSPDGRQMTFMVSRNETNGDIDVIRVGAGSPSSPVLATPATEWGGVLSPDGHWLAYVSNRSGRWEVYVAPFPGPGAPRQVSNDGGSEVVWRRDGRELFFRNGVQMFGVPVTPGASLGVGAPRLLFENFYVLGQPGLPNYDVSLDGQRFLMVQPDSHELSSQPVHVVVNGFDGSRHATVPGR